MRGLQLLLGRGHPLQACPFSASVIRVQTAGKSVGWVVLLWPGAGTGFGVGFVLHLRGWSWSRCF